MGVSPVSDRSRTTHQLEVITLALKVLVSGTHLVGKTTTRCTLAQRCLDANIRGAIREDPARISPLLLDLAQNSGTSAWLVGTILSHESVVVHRTT
jgi:hypothetical protein